MSSPNGKQRTTAPRTAVRRRSVLLMLACAFASAGCPQIIQFYTDCGESPTEDGESVPPCPEAGADGSDAGLDAHDDAHDADAS